MQASSVLPMGATQEREEDREFNAGYRDFCDLMRFFGPIRGLQVLGFCRIWAVLSNRPLAEIQTEMEAAGVSKSAMYRHLRHLRDWHTHLVETRHGDPGSVEEIARRLAFPPD